MTASALAGELGVPLLAIQLHAVITKFMGETAAKLHLIFDAMQRTRGVYLFDEFDAIGASRDRSNDVGEMRRVLNSFLQFLEQDESDSVIIAATNHAGKLDSALFRRFDDVVRYELPSPELATKLIKNRLGLFGVDTLKWEEILSAAEGLSYAELSRMRRRRQEGHTLRSHGNQHREPRVGHPRPARDQRAIGTHDEGGGWSWMARRGCVTSVSMTGRMRRDSSPRSGDATSSRCPPATGCRMAPA